MDMALYFWIWKAASSSIPSFLLAGASDGSCCALFPTQPTPTQDLLSLDVWSGPSF